MASVTCTAPGFVATNYRVHHAVAATEGGALYSWGSNVQGQAHHADPRPVVARPTRVLGFGNENGSDCTFGFRPGGEDGGAVVARSVLRVACGKWFTVAQVYNEQVMDEGAIEAGLEREAAAAARAEAMAAMMEEVEVEEEEEAAEAWNSGMVVATVAEDGTPVMMPGPMGDPIVAMPDPMLAVPMMVGEEAEGLEGAVGPPAAARRRRRRQRASKGPSARRRRPGRSGCRQRRWWRTTTRRSKGTWMLRPRSWRCCRLRSRRCHRRCRKSHRTTTTTMMRTCRPRSQRR